MTPRIGMSERDLQDSIVQLARQGGWLVMHTRPALNRHGKWSTPLQGNPGFVDLVLCRPPRLLLLELKSERGRLSPDQRVWIDALRGSGVDVRVIYPRDFDEIASVLTGGRAA